MNDGVHGWELFEGLRFILSLGNEDSSTEWEESTKQKRTGVFALYLLISIPPNFASEYQFGFVGNASFNSCKVNRFSRRERAPAFKRESVIFRVDSLERDRGSDLPLARRRGIEQDTTRFPCTREPQRVKRDSIGGPSKPTFR